MQIHQYSYTKGCDVRAENDTDDGDVLLRFLPYSREAIVKDAPIKVEKDINGQKRNLVAISRALQS